LLLGKVGENSKGGSNEDSSTSIVFTYKRTLYRGCVMEEFRLVFVSLGALGIIGYLVYVALSEGRFNRRR